MVVWLIGLSGAGKSTLADDIYEKLKPEIPNLVIVDGDVIREVFGGDLGHTLEDRRKNADRISRLCKYLDDSGVHVLCPILSIFRESQVWNRENIKNYFQVYLKTPIEDVVERDVKGLYGKFKRGELKDVAGMDMAFPEPVGNDIVFENNRGLSELLELGKAIALQIKGES